MARPSKTFLPQLLPKNDFRHIKWLKSLKNRPNPWNKGKTKLSDEGVAKISNTMKKKRIDNFKKWREQSRKNHLIPDSSINFKKTKTFAFLYGLILGDGNLNKLSRTECLRITLNSSNFGLVKYTENSITKVIGKSPSSIKRNKENCYNISIYQNNLSKRLGIPLGARKNLNIKLPNWIWGNKTYLMFTLKGLYEAEGSFSIHKKTYTYNFSFSNRNISLLNEVENALRTLGYNPERRKDAVRLRKKDEAFKFKKLISFRAYN